MVELENKEVELQEKCLAAEINKVADAKKYELEQETEMKKIKANAEAQGIEAKSRAEADAIKAKADVMKLLKKILVLCCL